MALASFARSLRPKQGHAVLEPRLFALVVLARDFLAKRSKHCTPLYPTFVICDACTILIHLLPYIVPTLVADCDSCEMLRQLPNVASSMRSHMQTLAFLTCLCQTFFCLRISIRSSNFLNLSEVPCYLFCQLKACGARDMAVDQNGRRMVDCKAF